MRNLYKVIGIVALVAVIGLGVTACSKKEGGKNSPPANPASDFRYDLTADGNGIKITRFTGSGKEVVFPSTIEDLPVLEIGNNVFDQKEIISIFIPDGVKVIEKGAFRGMVYTTSLVIPDSVEFIGEEAFRQMVRIKELTLPNGIKFIPKEAFLGLQSLTKINLPSSLEEIGWGAFTGCGELTELIIPDSLNDVKFVQTTLGGTNILSPDNGAFRRCGKLPIATRQRIESWGYESGFN